MLCRLELNRQMHENCWRIAGSEESVFFQPPSTQSAWICWSNWGSSALRFLDWGEITNLPYLRHIGRYGKPIILSTGMATLGEIEVALSILEKAGTQKGLITVLHCNTDYPTPMNDVNLLAMLTIRDAFGVEVGYSDHTLGIEVPVAAMALGATIIEKHFTLDRNLPGPDHRASLEPGELKAMVQAIRNIELALGDGISGPARARPKTSPSPASPWLPAGPSRRVKHSPRTILR